MRNLICLLSVAIAFTGISQKDSTITKRSKLPAAVPHMISFNADFNYPLLYSIGYYESDLYQHGINGALRLCYIYSTSVNFGLGLEYGIEMSLINLRSGGSFTFSSLITEDDLSIDHQGIRLITNNLMPKIEWKRRGEHRPYGLVHQFGIGVTMAQVVKRDYRYELNTFEYSDDALSQWLGSDPNDAEENYDPEQLYNFEHKPYWGGSLMYTLMYRGRLTESLLWSIGLRSQVNVTKTNFIRKDSQNEYEDMQYWITRIEMERLIARNRISSFWHFQLGLTYKLKD